MDPIERVNSLFAASAQLNAIAVESQAVPIARAAQCIVDCLLDGGKVLSCGNGNSAADAQYFAAQMRHRFERERPALPAVALSSDTTILTAIAADEGLDAIFAKQVSALGQPGDVLVILSTKDAADNLHRALEVSRERQMKVIGLTGYDSEVVVAGLNDDDIEIRAPGCEAARILENHRLVIHCLCDLIDMQLMGG